MFESLNLVRDICRYISGCVFTVDYSEVEDNFSFHLKELGVENGIDIYYKRVHDSTDLPKWILKELRNHYKDNLVYANLINRLSEKHPELLREYLENV